MSKEIGTGRGSVFYDKARKKWVAQVVDPAGKRIKKRFDKQVDASRWADRLHSDMVVGNYVTQRNTTVMEWVVQYIELYKKKTVRPRTVIRYFGTAKHLLPIGNVRLQQLTSPALQQFYNNMTTMTQSSFKKVHLLLNAALNKAVANEMIRRNPLDSVEIPKLEPPKPVEPFTDEELKKLASVLGDDIQMKLIVLLALLGGLRIGEILGLKSSKVFPTYIVIDNSLQQIAGKMVDCAPKTKAGYRHVALPEYLIAMLPRNNEYIFTSPANTPINVSNFNKRWKELLKKAGLPLNKHFHALRHTHATKLILAGVPIQNVSKRLGHSKISITLDTYTHALSNYDEGIPEKLTEIFSEF